jgi:hypothetical protein
MLRDRRGAHGELAGQRAGGEWAAAEQLDHPAAMGIGKGGEAIHPHNLRVDLIKSMWK